MTIAEFAHHMALTLTNWWRDREDERLDELADQDYRHVTDAANQFGVTAYQLVIKARNRGRRA